MENMPPDRKAGDSELTEAERIKAERDLLRIKLDALEQSFMAKKGRVDGKETLRKA